uniref:Glycosyl hydrolase family 13 catalytic domain-containing protein n=1 Tax=uncultured Bacillota bacterium TaxID=344338 RepID=A0A650EMN1_9FIRM|nr:hypothetical protein Firmicute1046_0860 [uncultured Firmicutes bacterium]
MQLFHDSQNIEYRCPFGAVPTEEVVTLRLRVSEGTAERVFLRLWIGGQECLMEMEKSDTDMQWFSVSVTMPSEAQLIWYYFIVESDGRRVYYSNQEDGLGGVGRQTDAAVHTSYQITVYERGFHTPDWFKHSIMYQIFPDRFCGIHHNGEIFKKREDYIIHGDWYEPLAFAPHPYEDGPACNDFYGGNLEGIRAKLPYLKDLGIGVLYLNPIFDAYSNHKYDTADYTKIDPMFGTEEDFRLLCADARALGIRVVLDGVFSHTGSDSVYFNKYGNYGEGGAYRDRNSPYAEWFDFGNEPPGYTSWWGCSNLPNVKEMTPSYLEHILSGSDAVVKHWVRAGASGWRLDVADELPDEFIEILRREVKSADENAVVIGEVWEDASNKESYSVLRRYLLGKELDSVMNYPWKDAVIAFLLDQIPAEALNRRLESLRENYPKEVFYSLMNIAGTHDTMRIKNVLGEQRQTDDMSGEQKQNARLSPWQETLALCRVRLMALLQMTYCGVPCIYYGDEIGMQGLSDPFNRMPYTWRQIDPQLQAYYRSLTTLRNENTFLRTGKIQTLYAQGGVYAYARYITDGMDVFGKPANNGAALCVVNRDSEAQTVCLNVSDFDVKEWTEFLRGETFSPAADGTLTVTLEGMSGGLFLPAKQ